MKGREERGEGEDIEGRKRGEMKGKERERRNGGETEEENTRQIECYVFELCTTS